jgi:hypothetical protein|tara:strand:- start:751 stop:1137 length:387 start_codon:yes stop_codon:yes gene_type:complete
MKIEVSIGEVIDKITILQIKKKNIDDAKKLHYVNEELNVLSSSLLGEGIDVPIKMVDSLREVNQSLWDTEDIIRLKEKNGEFDEEFVEHARKDAILNDQRFLIKNKINNHCKSVIKEQKSYEGLYTSN